MYILTVGSVSPQSIAHGKKLVGDKESNQCGENGAGILKTLAASGRFPDGGEGTRGPTQEVGSFILGRGEHYDPWEAL